MSKYLKFAVNKSLFHVDVTRWAPECDSTPCGCLLFGHVMLAAQSCDAADLLRWSPGCHRSLTRSHSGLH